MIVVGSNGGGKVDPAWCVNLRAHPEVVCLLKGAELALRAVELSGVERERAWALALKEFPGYANYQARLSRLIPVFTLLRSKHQK